MSCWGDNRMGKIASLSCYKYQKKHEIAIYKVKTLPGQKLNDVYINLSDVKRSLGLQLLEISETPEGLYMVASKKAYPRADLLKMLSSQSFRECSAPLAVIIGIGILFNSICVDLAQLPHIMFAGPTMSGKSSGLINLLLGIASRNAPDELAILIIDTGASSMNVFEELPHLAHSIAKEPESGSYVIRSLVNEMNRRKDLCNAELETLPPIVCIIDEFPSFINGLGDTKARPELSKNISELLLRGRHSKIHMAISAQEATKENTTISLNNITARAVYACLRHQQSQAALGSAGAEKLSGKGTMLFTSNDCSEPILIHGAYIEKSDAKQLVQRIKAASEGKGKAFSIPEWVADDHSDQLDKIMNDMRPALPKNEKELCEIIAWTLGKNEVSAKKIKEAFQIGNRVNDFISDMCRYGIISESKGKLPRQVLIDSVENLPQEVKELLERNNYPLNKVAEILERKKQLNGTSDAAEPV